MSTLILFLNSFFFITLACDQNGKANDIFLGRRILPLLGITRQGQGLTRRKRLNGPLTVRLFAFPLLAKSPFFRFWMVGGEDPSNLQEGYESLGKWRGSWAVVPYEPSGRGRVWIWNNITEKKGKTKPARMKKGG